MDVLYNAIPETGALCGAQIAAYRCYSTESTRLALTRCLELQVRNYEYLPPMIRSFADGFPVTAGAAWSTMNTRIDVALILWNTDVIELLSFVLFRRNLTSLGLEPSEAAERIEDLILSCGPSVAVYDLDPPYDRSAAAARQLSRRFPDVSFVMTCADPALALKNAPWLCEHPVFQKPYEIDDIVSAVRFRVRRIRKDLSRLSLS